MSIRRENIYRVPVPAGQIDDSFAGAGVGSVSTYRTNGDTYESPDVILSGGSNIIQAASMSPYSNIVTPYLESKIDAVAPSAKVTDYLGQNNGGSVVEPVKVEPVSTFSEAPSQAQDNEPDKNTVLKVAAAAVLGTGAGVGLTKIFNLFKKDDTPAISQVKAIETKTPEQKLKDLANLAGIAAAVFGLVMFLTKK